MVKAQSRRSASKVPWTDTEKRDLVLKAGSLRTKLKRTLCPNDFKRVKIRGRTFFAVKSQACRLGLYASVRETRPWSAREKHILVILGQKRRLGARSIKARGFFVPSNKKVSAGWKERSVDSIAQKMRREGYVDPLRSLRAKLARRLTPQEQRQLRKALAKNPQKKSTEEFAVEYGVAPSTIRNYRKRWRIKHSWQIAMSLPAARSKQKRLAEETRTRNTARWAQRKKELRNALRKSTERLLKKVRGNRKKIKWRRCQKCGSQWPANKRFFASSPKRRDGRVIATYLRRSCRACPRRGDLT